MPHAAPSPLPPARRRLAPGWTPPPGRSVALALLDADGTLRLARSGAVAPNAADDVLLLPGLGAPLRRLAAAGFLLAVLSNQAGVEDGHLTAAVADAALRHTLALLREQQVEVSYYDFAERRDGDRKPAPGMALRLADLLAREHGCAVDWGRSLVIGDAGWKRGADREPDGTPGGDFDRSDRLLAAELARRFGGVTWRHPREVFGWLARGVRRFDDPAAARACLAAWAREAPG